MTEAVENLEGVFDTLTDDTKVAVDELQKEVVEGTRWSGAEWADQKRNILIVGVGGIGSWLALSLSRIDHSLYLVDADVVDETNIRGGQAFRKVDWNVLKVTAVKQMCMSFGGNSEFIYEIPYQFDSEIGTSPITICGLDNMKARREVFENWAMMYGNTEGALFMDGRLTAEMLEIFTICGGDSEAIAKYDKDHLFSDEDAALLDCTLKQTTFAAMGIASLMTATLCNFLANGKSDVKIRDVPFYQRMIFPILAYTAGGGRI